MSQPERQRQPIHKMILRITPKRLNLRCVLKNHPDRRRLYPDGLHRYQIGAEGYTQITGMPQIMDANESKVEYEYPTDIQPVSED